MHPIRRRPALLDQRLNGRTGEILETPRTFIHPVGDVEWRAFPSGHVEVRSWDEWRKGWSEWCVSGCTLDDLVFDSSGSVIETTA